MEMIAKIYGYSRGTKDLLATITLLKNGTAKIETVYETLQKDWEGGFPTSKGGRVTPDNGRLFIEELPKSYSGSYMNVEIT